MLKFNKLSYRPEIDGIRTLAVIPVVLYHFKASFKGGFAGVDVFFVISGYLITSILIHELKKSNTVSIKNFWERRARRLFPALAFMLTILLVSANYVFLPPSFTSLMRQIKATMTMTANYHFAREFSEGYFSIEEVQVPLLHCWSLAVEEQFYVAYPVIILVMWKSRLRKPLYFSFFCWEYLGGLCTYP